MAAELQAGRAFVDLVPRLTPGAAASAQAQMGGVFSGLAGKAKLAGAAVGVGLAAGVVGVGALGLSVGKSFDDAFDTIRTGTGKTGAALEGLKGSFRAVAADVPDDFGRVSTAISELSTRTGQTGPALEGLATQVLTLSRLTGEDLSATIEGSTRLFGDWGVAVEDQAGSLDFLYKVSQATGVGVNALSEDLVKFGAPLRQLGFGMEESAALLGKFEKEGVNAGLVMGSLRIALGKMARDGEPAQETLARVTDQIKNAGSTSEANALALELFGARAGPDMAAAIREGRFAVDDLVAGIEGSGETILGAAAETDDFAEKFAKLKNRVTLALEPLGELTFEVLNKLADFLLPVVDSLGKKLPGAFRAVSKAVAPVIGGIRQVFEILANRDFVGGGPFAEDSPIVAALFRFRDYFVNELLPAIRQVFDFVSRNAKPILAGLAAAFLLVTSPVTAVVAALVLAYTRFEAFRTVVDAVIRFLTTVVVPAVATFVAYVVEQFSNLVAFVQEHWAAIQEAIEHVVNVVSAVISGFVDAVLLVWSYFGDTILAVISAAWENVRAVIEFAVDLIAGIIEAGLAIINGDWGAAWDAIVGILSSAWELVKTVLGNALGVVKTLIGDGMDAAAALVSGAIDRVVGFFSGMGGRIARAAGDVFGFLWDSFRGAINLVIRGWNRLEFRIPGFDPPGPGPKFGGFTLGVPNIPELWQGGDVTRAGLAIVGDRGAELLELDAGARVTPLDTLEELAGAALGRGDGLTIEHLEVPTATDATADEVVDAIGAKLGWKLTTRRDR